jgi:hypothetical protein
MRLIAASLLLLICISPGLAQNTTRDEVRIYLNTGAVIEVDEATVGTDVVWYKRGELTAALQLSRVSRIIKGVQTLYPATARERKEFADATRGMQRDLIKAAEEYKASLRQLISHYEAQLSRDRERLKKAKELRDSNLLDERALANEEANVSASERKLAQTRERLERADDYVNRAQSNPCALKVAEAPEVRGFKLGQTYEEIKRGFPNEDLSAHGVDSQKPNGVRQIIVAAGGYTSRLRRAAAGELPEGWSKRFEGVSRAEVQLLDDKVASVKIVYDDTAKWEDPLEFTAAIAEGLKLPRQGWRGKYPTVLDCDGFTVETEAVTSYSTLTIQLTDFVPEVKRREAEAERAKRKVFKP